MCYDISDQVIPAVGRDVIIKDLEDLHSSKSEGRWTGGEFLTGKPEFFAQLTIEAQKIFPAYVKIIDHIHHVGDESITSAALEVIRKKGRYVADAGTLGIVGRYWSGRTRHAQRPFDHYLNSFLLHLPQDKRFLAELEIKFPMDRTWFGRQYADRRNSWRNRLWLNMRRIKKVLSGKRQ